MSVSEAKVARLANGNPPRVMDVFSGCGGLSLGFAAAGAQVVSAVEFDDLASLTHATNFHGNLNGAAFDAHSRPRDIVQTEPERLMGEQYPASTAVEMVDILVGGPPCQAFARVGRAKLREVDEHPQAFALDPRGNLYLRYLQYVRELKPLAILMENVPDALNWGGHNIAEEVCEVLDGLGYNTRYTLLNSALYGVPQTRERMLLIAYRAELGSSPRSPTRRTTPNCQRATVALGLSHSSTLRRACYSITTTRPPLHPEMDCCLWSRRRTR